MQRARAPPSGGARAGAPSIRWRRRWRPTQPPARPVGTVRPIFAGRTRSADGTCRGFSGSARSPVDRVGDPPRDEIARSRSVIPRLRALRTRGPDQHHRHPVAKPPRDESRGAGALVRRPTHPPSHRPAGTPDIASPNLHVTNPEVPAVSSAVPGPAVPPSPAAGTPDIASPNLHVTNRADARASRPCPPRQAPTHQRTSRTAGQSATTAAPVSRQPVASRRATSVRRVKADARSCALEVPQGQSRLTLRAPTNGPPPDDRCRDPRPPGPVIRHVEVRRGTATLHCSSVRHQSTDRRSSLSATPAAPDVWSRGASPTPSIVTANPGPQPPTHPDRPEVSSWDLDPAEGPRRPEGTGESRFGGEPAAGVNRFGRRPTGCW